MGGNILKIIRKTRHSDLEEIIMFIAVFGSSALGAQIFGVSVNKLVLIPLEIWLILKMKSKININSNQLLMLIWYVFAVLSCIIGGIYIKAEFSNRLILYIIQVCFIYIPIMLLLNNLNEPLEKFKVAIIKTAKINAVWAIVQFICWYLFQLDFNDWVFNGIFKGIFGTDWTVWTFDNGVTTGLRVSGLNGDTAFFALIMLFGICLDKNKFWKIVYYVACAFSLSRSGIVALTAVLLFQIFMNKKRKVSAKVFIRTIILVALIIGIAVQIYITSPYVQYQVDYILARFASLGAGSSMDVGTLRHLYYIPVSIYIWLFEFSIVKKLIGVGARVGGTAMIASPYAKDAFTFSPMMYSSAWSVECDVAELLMGHGIVGYILLYIEFRLYKKMNNSYKAVILGLMIMGIMYGVIETTIVQFFLICAVANQNSENISDASVSNKNVCLL